jgi:hypothetical protein
MVNYLKQQKKHKDSFFYLLSIPLFLVFLAVFLLARSSNAYAATLIFSPSSGTYNVGTNFTVNVYLSSADQAMNAASGVINFPADKLEVVSFSKEGSIFNLWVQEPTFSNNIGTFNFEGVVLNPGFSGQNGKIITINFRSKAAGKANLNFSSASILANDGQGTNIITSLGNATFDINNPPNIPIQENIQSVQTQVKEVLPPAPSITSPTHPDQKKWYNLNTAKFKWLLPNDIEAVKLSFDKRTFSQPHVLYSPPITEKEIQDLEDGIYYFHAQFKNKNGWGEIGHFRFQIDTKPPETFTINFLDGKTTDNLQPKIIFNTTDTLSGIAYYKLIINNNDPIIISPEALKDGFYLLPPQQTGTKSITIQAFDKAGNYTTVTDELTIQGLNPPTINDYPQTLQEGEFLIIKGATYPRSTVTIYLKKGDSNKTDSQTVKSDENGNFTLVWNDKLTKDTYRFWAEVTDERGVKSPSTNNYIILVKQAALLRIGFLVITYLTAIISLAVIIISLLFFGWYLIFRFNRFREKVRKEVAEAEQVSHKAFSLLRTRIAMEIRLLERARTKRQLTAEELKIIQDLQQSLQEAEQVLRQEIENIGKEK